MIATKSHVLGLGTMTGNSESGSPPMGIGHIAKRRFTRNNANANAADTAELDWGDAIESHILENTADGDRSLPYSIARNSRKMIDSWKAENSVDALMQLRLAFQAFDLPRYSYPGDWQSEVSTR